jgi:DNA-directed RNA polymerase specialized sigma24 family protein
MLPYVKTENTYDDREMFLRLYVKRHKAGDIAEDMGIKPSTVRDHAKDVAIQARELYYKKMEQF